MRRKLRMIDEARELKDIGNIPGNRLKKLKGDRRGQYSIRVNDQWRICFRWTGADAEEVEIVDYHS
jgi:toxin HigB-1